METKDVSTPVFVGHMAATGRISILISPRRVTRILAAVVAFLVVAHFAVMYSSYYLGHRVVLGLVPMFDLRLDENVPTWYSSAALLVCSALLAVIALAKRTTRGSPLWHWLGLSLVFLFLSMDETATIHENVQRHLRRGIDPDHALYGPASIAFPALIALSVLVVSLKFLAALPRKTAVLFIAAGAVFVGGAIGMDYVGELHKISYGFDTMTYAMISGLEEAFEMAGVVVFLYALLDYIRDHIGKTVSFTISRP